MENPFKEPQKGCVLCNVQVDYKNIQVSLGPVALHQVRRVCFQSETQYQETTNVIHLSTCMHNKLKRDKRRVFKEHGKVFCFLKFIRLNGSSKCFPGILGGSQTCFPLCDNAEARVRLMSSKARREVRWLTEHTLLHTPASTPPHQVSCRCIRSTNVKLVWTFMGLTVMILFIHSVKET